MPRGHNQPMNPAERNQVPRLIWFACCCIVFGGIVGIGISVFLPNWREAGPITYNYIHKASKRQHTVDQTKYGLYSVVYDNFMTKQSWSKRLSNVKAKGYMAIQNSAQNHRGGYKNFFVNECPAACRDGISARIRVYENLLGYNNILLMILVIIDIVAVLGLLWAIFVNKNMPIVGGCWFLAGIIGLPSTIYWNRATHKTWLIAVRSQMIPFPYLSYCYTTTLFSTAGFIVASLLLFFSDRISFWLKKRKGQSAFNHYANEHKLEFGSPMAAFGKGTAPNMQVQNMGHALPVMGKPVAPESGFNPGSLFNGVGFSNAQGGGNQANSPSMWAKNFQL